MTSAVPITRTEVERVNEPKLTQLHAAEPRIRVAGKEVESG